VLSQLDKTARLLDIGCGTGLLVHALQQAGFADIRGFDLSSQQIAVATRRGLPCELVDADHLHRLADAEPSSVDGIFLMDVLEHIPVGEQMRFASALSRLLKANAPLVISVPNASSTFATRWRYMDWTHQCCFTEHSLAFVLRNQGFESIDFLPYEYGAATPLPWLHRLGFYVNLLRRLEAIGELGRQGLHVPLGLNPAGGSAQANKFVHAISLPVDALLRSLAFIIPVRIDTEGRPWIRNFKAVPVRRATMTSSHRSQLFPGATSIRHCCPSMPSRARPTGRIPAIRSCACRPGPTPASSAWCVEGPSRI
jgi:SAM-dependent methyltransferase